jgi:membrane protein XagC
MRRLVPVAAMMLVVCGVVFAVARSAATAGLVPNGAVTLWAGAITAGEGQMPIGRMLAAYPTVPFLATTLVDVLTPAGTPSPVLLTAAVLALFAGALLVTFRRIGVPMIAGPLMVLLIVLHPAMLRAATAGPAEMIFAVFLFLLGRALFDLRARSGASEVMAAGLSLLGLSFSHPMGAAIACAAAPLFVLSIHPDVFSRSSLNLLLALLFPTAFCIAAFSYMSWIFPGSGWTFLIAPTEGVAAWAAGFASLFGRGLTGSLSLDAGLVVIAAVLIGAPIAPVAIISIWRLRPLLSPTLMFVAMTAAAAGLAVTTGVFGDPAAAAVMPPILAAIIIIHMPPVRRRSGVVMTTLVLGWFGGIAGLAIADPGGAVNVAVALEGGDVDAERVAAINLGKATVGRDGVLVDALNAPAVVLGREGARGLLAPSDEAFTLAILFSRIDAPFVAVPDPQIGIGAQDRLNKAFPKLYRRGAAGYRLIFENAGWRLFARMETAVGQGTSGSFLD